jgi:ribosomal protein S18 acetylase RimI-like enzyme
MAWYTPVVKAWQVARSEGPANFWFKLCSALGYRRLILFERKVTPPGGELSLPPGAWLQLLEEAQISDYLRFRPEVRAADIRRRFRAGHLCFVVGSTEHILSATWVALRRADIDYLQWELPLGNNEAYVYDAYTLKDWRGSGLSSTLSAFISEQLQRRGITRSWRAVMPENSAAMAMQSKLGSRPVWRITSLRLGPWRWLGRSSPGTNFRPFRAPWPGER